MQQSFLTSQVQHAETEPDIWTTVRVTPRFAYFRIKNAYNKKNRCSLLQWHVRQQPEGKHPLLLNLKPVFKSNTP